MEKKRNRMGEAGNPDFLQITVVYGSEFLQAVV